MHMPLRVFSKCIDFTSYLLYVLHYGKVILRGMHIARYILYGIPFNDFIQYSEVLSQPELSFDFESNTLCKVKSYINSYMNSVWNFFR